MIEHETNTVPNGPPQGAVPDGANLEVYGDWVTVDAGPAPAAQPAAPEPAAAAASLEVTYQEPDSRTAPELTAAEEALLDQLSESERAAPAAAAAVDAGPNGAGSQATDAALAKLERQLSSLSAELKAVGQQLAELRGRSAGAAENTPEPAAPPAPEYAAEAGFAAGGAAVDDEAPVITLEALEAEAGPPAAAPADWGGHAAPEAAVAAADAAPATVAAPAPEAPQVTVEPLAAAESPAPAPAAPTEPPAAPSSAAAQEAAAADDGQSAIQLAVDPAAGPPPAAPGAEISGQVRTDVRAVLAYLDQLLDALPPDKVKEFAQSEHFATYKKLFQEFGLDD